METAPPPALLLASDFACWFSFPTLPCIVSAVCTWHSVLSPSSCGRHVPPLLKLLSLCASFQNLFQYHLVSKADEFLKLSTFLPDLSSVSYMAPLLLQSSCSEHMAALPSITGRFWCVPSTALLWMIHLGFHTSSSECWLHDFSFLTCLPLLTLSPCLILRGSTSRWN